MERSEVELSREDSNVDTSHPELVTPKSIGLFEIGQYPSDVSIKAESVTPRQGIDTSIDADQMRQEKPLTTPVAKVQ